MTAEDLERWDRDHVWHPFTPMSAYEPFVIERAEGCLLFDIRGRSYIDGVSSLWCNVHGHRVPELDEAIREQLGRVAHTTLLGQANVPSTILARRLAEAAPQGLTRVFFSDNGATAVEVALKMAFQYWRQRSDPRPRKTKFLSLRDAYHGDTLGSVSVGDLGTFHHLFAPLLFPVVRAAVAADEVVPLIERHADELAAVVVEPLVQGAAGMVLA
ncbi:MAG: aminotransferase class III-fold pyridoxal phosphate-dependent enzyme, partial [Thermoleophilia bacterium]|nr:aminotransferase class III-fold pyridoxal phosphate-dependent enzyme [Thermoleophilia bacterium]